MHAPAVSHDRNSGAATRFFAVVICAAAFGAVNDADAGILLTGGEPLSLVGIDASGEGDVQASCRAGAASCGLSGNPQRHSRPSHPSDRTDSPASPSWLLEQGERAGTLSSGGSTIVASPPGMLADQEAVFRNEATTWFAAQLNLALPRAPATGLFRPPRV